MSTLLILGASSIVKRRVLPGILRAEIFSKVDIASRSNFNDDDFPGGWKGDTYNDYQAALDNSDAEIVYISLINSMHRKWAEIAIASGKHVVVDKPAFLSLREAQALLVAARRKGVLLSEATVFPYHPQIDAAQALLEKDGTSHVRLSAQFSFPPFPSSNFRNFKEFGGGAINDLGPYVAATSRVLIGQNPTGVVCKILSRHPESGVEIAFSVMLTYGNGSVFTGVYGFDTEYTNQLSVLTNSSSFEIRRIYTTPPDMNVVIRGTSKSETFEDVIEASDMFVNYFRVIKNDVRTGDYERHGSVMLHDAAIVESLREKGEQD